MVTKSHDSSFNPETLGRFFISGHFSYFTLCTKVFAVEYECLIENALQTIAKFCWFLPKAFKLTTLMSFI